VVVVAVRELLAQDQGVLVELEAAVLVARVRLSQVQPLDQMELMVSAVAVVAQEEQGGHTTHLAAATAALA
jgi:hypothetical protein